MRRLVTVLALVTALAVPAWAKPGVPQEYVRLERVDSEPTYAGLVKLRAFVSLMQIQGGFIGSVEPKDLDLMLADGEQKYVPMMARWEHQQEPLDLIIVVEIAKQFAEALEELGRDERMKQFLDKLPKGTRVAIITYGAEVKVAVPLGEPRAAAKKWDDIFPEDDYAPPVLIKAVNRALTVLANAKPPTLPHNSVRRVILVLSDGIDDVDDPYDDFDTRKRFTEKLIKPAMKAGVTVHTIAFSPYDNRAPFLNLGELSKKTDGTFRWARGRAFIGQALDLVTEQLRRQIVLTYLVPAAKVAEGTKVRILCRAAGCGEELPLKSRSVAAPAPRCGGETCPASGVCVEHACRPALLDAERTMGAGTWIALAGGGLAGISLLTLLVRRRKGGKLEAPKSGKTSGQTGAMPGIVGAVINAPPSPPAAPMPGQPGYGGVASGLPAYGLPGAPAAPPAPLPGQPGYGGVASGLPAYGMPGAPPIPSAAAFQAPAAKGSYLTIVNGAKAGQTLPLRHGFNIGKNPQNDLVIDDGYTSGYHAQVVMDAQGGCTLHDMQSTNGTFVNGVRTTTQRLTNGMVIRVGQTELRFLQG